MLRASNPAASMQKTYDEVFLMCSTAIYFEQQNNEEEALRSWRGALDQIYYHNAYKVPANYRAKSETEKAVQDSLRDMELQCKERVDLFEALRKSRAEASEKSRASSSSERLPFRTPEYAHQASPALGYSVQPTPYASISRPPIPHTNSSRSSLPMQQPVSDKPRASSAASLQPPPVTSRSSSPEKRSSMFKSTLRSDKKGTGRSSSSNMPQTMRAKPPKSASQAATLAWPGLNAALLSGQPNGHANTSRTSPINNIERRRSPSPQPPMKSRPRSVERSDRHEPVSRSKPAVPKPSTQVRVEPPPLPKAPVMTYRQEYNPDTRTINTRKIPQTPPRDDGDNRRSSVITRKALNTNGRRENPLTPLTNEDLIHSDQSLAPEPLAEITASEGCVSEADTRQAQIMKNLPKGVDEQAAKAIFNEIVIKGDEVHWEDVAGLDIAKTALKEAVVYPFLRPDLFMGLREPARGMLLFGPPGTGKTMLARAVATESRSTFFAISASSLTSKYLGESEKLVRALFALAKAMTPSIIFVDEIDSLLSARSGSGEHEATRRIKTEFLIQWSDLAKAAAGREQTDGDASRVLVLAATNLPWAIDEAARRRFVRRQYIPLPEAHVRGDQLRRLMSAQKHDLRDLDFASLVRLTDGFSGSDITALAKDAAMGPLRSLGEKLLHMAPDEIRPINLSDFRASLVNIRPSVSKQGLKEFEDWAREFGERGG